MPGFKRCSALQGGMREKLVSPDYTVFSPQVFEMNYVFMSREALRPTPCFWLELSVWDGHESDPSKDKRSLLCFPWPVRELPCAQVGDLFRNRGGLFNRDKFRYSEDYDFYLQLLLDGHRLACLDEPPVYYRRTGLTSC